MDSEADKLLKKSKAMKSLEIPIALDRDLWGGRESMREAAKNRLPQMELESDTAYKIRLYNNRFFPAYKSGVRSTVGRLRRANAEFTKDKYASLFDLSKINSIMADMDLYSLRYRISFLMIVDDDYQIIPTPSVLQYKEGGDGGLNYLRYKADSAEGADVVVTIEKIEEGATIAKYTIKDNRIIDTSTDVMSFFPVLHYEVDSQAETPYFYDLACLNEDHWKTTSMQVHAIMHSRFRILWGNNLPPDLMVAINSPSSILDLGEGGKLEVVAGGEQGIEAGREDIADLEQKMGTLSARPFSSMNTFITATEVDRTSLHEDSPIRLMGQERIAMTKRILILKAKQNGFKDPSKFVAADAELSEIKAGSNDADMLLRALALDAIDSDAFTTGFYRAIPALQGVKPE